MNLLLLLLLACWLGELVPDMADCGVQGVPHPVVSGAGAVSPDTWLMDPECLRDAFSLLVGGTRAQGFPEPFPDH